MLNQTLNDSISYYTNDNTVLSKHYCNYWYNLIIIILIIYI